MFGKLKAQVRKKDILPATALYKNVVIHANKS